MTRTTAPATARRLLPDAPLLVAARGERPNHVPVWFMRQAGRSLPEYRQLRADLPMLQACMTPELVCEITLQPVRRHGVDAAILFSDIMVPLHAAGIELDIVPGTGPVVDSPVRSAADVMALPALEHDRAVCSGGPHSLGSHVQGDPPVHPNDIRAGLGHRPEQVPGAHPEMDPRQAGVGQAGQHPRRVREHEVPVVPLR